MTVGLSGFITTPVETIDYRVGEKLPEEPGLDTWFFVDLAVKSIGQTYLCQIVSRSAEFAATRGSCGAIEMEA